MSRDENGTVSVLIVAFSICLLLTITAVTDVTSAYLRRQTADSLADGAALAGSSGAAGSSVYGSVDGGYVEVAEEAARVAVAEYFEQSGAVRDYPGLDWAVRVDGPTVFVDLDLPYTMPVPFPGFDSETTVHGSAASRLPVY